MKSAKLAVIAIALLVPACQKSVKENCDEIAQITYRCFAKEIDAGTFDVGFLEKERVHCAFGRSTMTAEQRAKDDELADEIRRGLTCEEFRRFHPHALYMKLPTTPNTDPSTPTYRVK